jgi:hypothetical protein
MRLTCSVSGCSAAVSGGLANWLNGRRIRSSVSASEKFNTNIKNAMS